MSDGKNMDSSHSNGGGEPTATVATSADVGGRLPVGFANPGLPPHRHRMADEDQAAAKRAERQVATLFTISILGTVLTLVAYFAVKFEGHLSSAQYLKRVQLSNTLLGLGLFLALFALGIGAVHWARTLMPDVEQVEERHELRGTEEERAAAVGILGAGADESGLGRRPLIRNTLLGAMALLPLPALAFLRDTGPMPAKNLDVTVWKAGTRLARDPQGEPIKASDLTIGSIVHVMPEGIDKLPNPLEERAKAAVLLLRLEPTMLTDATQALGYQGIIAYSKICTHLGCPVALYEQQTHLLLCPCHQSTFDITQDCKVVFGPAKRPLPQLPITVDEQGYLVAKDGFNQPVGPSFWERS